MLKERLGELLEVTENIDALWLKFNEDYSDLIDEFFREYAEDNIDFFYHDLDNFLTNNIELVEADIDNFGWSGSLYEHIKSAEFIEILDDLYRYTKEIIEYCIIKYVIDKNLIINNEAKFIELIESYIVDLDIDNTTEELINIVEKALTSL